MPQDQGVPPTKDQQAAAPASVQIGPAGNGAVPIGRSRPRIRHNNYPMRRVTKWSLDAVRLANNPPKIFQQGNVLVRTRETDEGRTYIEPLTLDALRGHLDRAADYFRAYERKDGQGGRPIYGPPPLDFVRDIMSLPGWPADVFPALRGIVQAPYFTAEGVLVDQAGYNTDTKLWYDRESGLNVPPVSKAPTDSDIAQAKAWILNELLGDFPFQSAADQQNALAFMLTPFIRPMINGPVPLGLIEAPVAGTGKGLCANALAITATGGTLETIPQRTSDDEWRKAITAKLIELPTYILFDNLSGTLRSPSLEAVLTSECWSDRILGENRMVRVKITAIWLATANNLQVDGDLPRRIVSIRLDAKMERPDEREPSKFKHPALLRWAKENRGQAMWAALTLIQAWITRGKPAGRQTMGSYESWAQTLGGILEVCGMTAFLTNLRQFRQNVDSDVEQLGAFVRAWYKKLGVGPVGVAHLYTLAAEMELLPFIMVAEKEHGRKAKLGRYLARNRDRTVDGYQILALNPDSRGGCRRYRLKAVDEATAREDENKYVDDPERLRTLMEDPPEEPTTKGTNDDPDPDRDTEEPEDEFEEGAEGETDDGTEDGGDYIRDDEDQSDWD